MSTVDALLVDGAHRRPVVGPQLADDHRQHAATIVVERDGHKGMVIGDKGEKLKRIGTETRQELEKLWDCKVYLELWVKVRSGWADDDARVRSFGYE